jgi:prepilin-type N-terminal cleavage/methylation domain-containing protein
VKRTGFTLIECLIGLALSLIVVTAGLQFSMHAQAVFSSLKAREEADQAARAAIDRMRIDLLHAGRGLAAEIGLGLATAAEAGPLELRLTSAARTLELAAAAAAGSTRISLASTADLAAGRLVALRRRGSGEVRTVLRVEAGAAVLDAPLEHDYAPDAAAVSLLDVVTYFLDGTARVLRRRANASSAQPLCENVSAASWSLDPSAPLVRLRLELAIEGVHPHEATVFIKNAALSRS